MLAWHTLESQLLIAVSHQQTKFYLGTLQYRIVVQDRISMQGEEIAILDKHAGSNKIVQAIFFVKKWLK